MTIVLLEALSFGLGRLADAAAQVGQRLVLFTGHRSLYLHELSRLPDGALEVVDLDTDDEAACAAALARIHDLAGLISSTDTWGLAGARLATQFGLPGPGERAVRTARDKGEVRRLLHERGLGRGVAIDVPDGTESAAGVDEVLRSVGLPAIVKDSAGTSSRDVWLARSTGELRYALAAAGTSVLKGRLIAEPFFAGPIYSAETLTWQGKTRLLGVSSRQLSAEPWFREEACAFPVGFGEKDLASVQEWVAGVLAAAGQHRGFAHVEFALTADGPELVEINGRIGGAMVGEALCRSLGTNVYVAMIEMALGRRPALLDAAVPGGPATAFVLVYAPVAGTLTGWSGIDALAAYPGDPEWYPTAPTGRRLEHLTDQRGCTGIVLVHGDTAELALHRALSAAGAVRPLLDP
ncbi:ATP-grasp domain-containing protein [Amycolatopsis nigrescens]|uniref:ATP-grasp domain-containing protein n=1 Tax=Amycolatopsis nigrescens TaxID=381445 RepID=UPI00036FA937|nr:ATP-grasp domain-containing protein [Amycolatopsis nigrescens]